MISFDDAVGTGVGVGEDANIDIVSLVDSDAVTIVDDSCNRNKIGVEYYLGKCFRKLIKNHRNLPVSSQ